MEVKQKPLATLILFLLGTQLVLVPRFIIAPWDNYRFILSSLGPLLFFGACLFDKEYSLKCSKKEFFWILLIGLAGLSFFWATNQTLIWYPFFILVCFYLWIITLSSINLDGLVALRPINLLLGLFWINIIYIVFIVLLYGLSELHKWNYFFGYNANYLSAYIICLFSFLLFFNFNSRRGFYTKIIGGLCVLVVLYLSKARGSTIAFVVILIYYLLIMLHNRNVKLVTFLLVLTSLTIISFICIYTQPLLFEQVLTKIKETNSPGTSHRFFMIRRSLEIISSNLLTGIGFGNWQMEAYNTDLSNIRGFNHPIYLFRLGNHNYYSQIIVELGILGFSFFFLPFLIFIKKIIFQRKPNDLLRAILASILVYLTVSFFYQTANCFEFHFSGIQFLAFSGIGIAMNFSEENLYLISSKLIKSIYFILALSSFGWFNYYNYTYNQYQEIKSIYKNEDKTSQITQYDGELEHDRINKGNESTIQILEQLYNPIFKNTHHFYKGSLGINQSLLLDLALQYQKVGDYDLAETYYLRALKFSPNDELILRSFAKFLLRIRKDINNAKKYGLHAYKIQHNNHNHIILMAEISIAENNMNKAREYLEFFDKVKGDYTTLGVVKLMLADIAIKQGKFVLGQKELDAFKKMYRPRYQDLYKSLLTQLTKMQEI